MNNFVRIVGLGTSGAKVVKDVCEICEQKSLVNVDFHTIDVGADQLDFGKYNFFKRINLSMKMFCVRDSNPLGTRLAGCPCQMFLGARLRCKSYAGVPKVRPGSLAI